MPFLARTLLNAGMRAYQRNTTLSTTIVTTYSTSFNTSRTTTYMTYYPSYRLTYYQTSRQTSRYTPFPVNFWTSYTVPRPPIPGPDGSSTPAPPLQTGHYTIYDPPKLTTWVVYYTVNRWTATGNYDSHQTSHSTTFLTSNITSRTTVYNTTFLTWDYTTW